MSAVDEVRSKPLRRIAHLRPRLQLIVRTTHRSEGQHRGHADQPSPHRHTTFQERKRICMSSGGRARKTTTKIASPRFHSGQFDGRDTIFGPRICAGKKFVNGLKH
jgi:hypothetical protein